MNLASSAANLLSTLVFLSSLFALGCASDPEARVPAPPQIIDAHFAMPPFYRVEGHGGTDLLLLGTIHLGPQSGWRFSPAILRGIDLADRFVLEIDLREATEEAVSNILASTVVLQPPDTLPEIVSPETAKLLEEMDAELASLGMPVNARLRLKPWFVAMSLIEYAAQRSGYSGSASAESVVMDRLDSRPVEGLEGFEEQIAMLDGLSPANQDVMLRDTLLRLDGAIEGIHELVDAWRLGDEEELEALARAGIDELPELETFYEVLLGDRNRRWIETFRSILDEPDSDDETVFVAVGALHLVGEDGVVDLLREAGYSVERVDHFRGLEK